MWEWKLAIKNVVRLTNWAKHSEIEIYVDSILTH